MRRITAFALLVVGQSLVAMLDPAVALMPAFATFLLAGTLMAKQTLTDTAVVAPGQARRPLRASEPSGGKVAD